MNIHILYDFTDNPWGGGNQFLKSLRRELINRGIYTDEANSADLILINSHHKLDQAKQIISRNPNIKIIHRIDGPVYLIRGFDYKVDKEIFFFNQKLASGTVFQSYWSREHNYQLGLKKKKMETIIMNAPDSNFFFPTKKTLDKKKIKIIISSWSSNMRKGYNYYSFLDNHLDFNKYSVTFIGNSPIIFKNIEQLDPVPSLELGELLRNHDIFLTASENDPCSNSLIEALHCGLPAIALNSGGHPEIIKDGGLLFKTTDDIINQIEKLTEKYEYYKKNISLPNSDDVANQYISFFSDVHNLNPTYSRLYCIKMTMVDKIRKFL